MSTLSSLYTKQSLYQLVKFGIIGTSNTAIDAIVYFALTRFIPFFAEQYLFAAFISFIVSTLNGFYWNRRWTFRVGTAYSHQQLVKFFFVNIVALSLNQVVFWWLVQGGMYDVLAKVFAGVSAGLINFSLQKLWAFAQKEIEEIEEWIEEKFEHAETGQNE